MKGRKSVFSGDIGCYTLGNAKPLDMVDTCLCMGAGVTIAQGLHRVEPDTVNFAFIGDSTFFHTGIPGVINAIYNNTDIVLVVLDNSTTAMTGNQPHPGTGKTMMGNVTEKVSIYNVLSAIGVNHIERANPFDLEAAKEAVTHAASAPGVSAIIFEAPCIQISKAKPVYQINRDKCTNCKRCIKELGCPAIIIQDGQVTIDPALCYGCSICAQVCPFHAIGGTIQ
jgi:indolepyruvate ferredoxin oxidoreductase alpha subunit